MSFGGAENVTVKRSHKIIDLEEHEMGSERSCQLVGSLSPGTRIIILIQKQQTKVLNDHDWPFLNVLMLAVFHGAATKLNGRSLMVTVDHAMHWNNIKF